MSFWEHLDELRRRLLRALMFVILGAIAGFWFAQPAIEVLVTPFREQVQGTLALLAPQDGFIIEIKMAILLGVLLASPFIAHQLYGFVGPGLRREEKRWLWPVAFVATVLFWGGVAFAWVVFPAALQFLASFAHEGIQNFWSLKTYINLLIFLLLAFGVIFQLPLIIGLLIATGAVGSHVFRRNRRYAIVIMFILAALATPTTDMLTMLLMVGPLIVLYELSIWIGVGIEKRRAKRNA